MRAGLGEAGQRCAVFAVPGGRVGHIDVRRGHVQRNRVGLAVVCADVVLDRIDDAVLLRLQELHDLGTLHGGIVLLLDPVPDGVRANFAEAGLVGAVFAALGGGIAHLRVRGGDVQLNGVRLAVGIAAVAPGAVLDDARIDCHGACAIRGCIAHLFQQEPDDIVAGIGEHGQRFAYYAALLGIGHVNALGEHVQRNRVRLAVVVAGVVLHGVEDRARLRDGYSGGVHDGLVALLLQLEPDGVRAYVGKAGHVGAVFAALGGGEGRGNALGDDVQRDGVGFAVVVAGVVLHAVLDLAQLHDGHGGEVHDGFITRLLQLEPDGVRTRLGEAGQSSAVCAVLGGRIGCGYALSGNVQRNGVRFAVVIAGVVADRVLDLAKFRDGHAGGIHDGFTILLLQLEPDGVRTRLGKAGQSSAVCAILGGRVGHAHALGGNVQRDGVRFAVVIAGVVADRVLDLAQFHDGHAGGIHDGFAVLLLQLEPDSIFAGLGEAGLCSGVRAVLGGGKGRGYTLGGDVQRNGVRFAVIVAIEALHGVVDLRQLLDGHVGGAHDGFIALLLQPEPDGIFAGLGEARLCGGVRAVLGGGECRGYALGGNVQRNRVRLTIVVAAVAADGILDDREGLRFDDGEAVADRCAIVAALAADGSGVAARHAGCALQTEIALIVFNRPLLNLVGGKIELHRCSGAGEAARKRGFDIVADVNRMDLHGYRAFFGFVALLFKPVVNNVHTGFGERGVCFAVRPFIGCGVAHAHAIRADSQRDRMGLAVVINVKALDAVFDFLLRLVDGKRMVDMRVVVSAIAADLDAVAARIAGRSTQRCPIGIAVGHLPRLNTFVEGC